MIATPEKTSDTKTRRRKGSHPAPIDPTSLPPSVIQPLGKRYCHRCYRYKYEQAFQGSGDDRMCGACARHLRELADIMADDPNYDEKVAKLNEELKKDIDQINLPRVADVLTEFFAQEGGTKESVAKIRFNLDWLDNHKPGSGVAMNTRMGFLKLLVAWEAVQLARAKQEKMPSVQDAMKLVEDMIGNFAKHATRKQPHPALAGLGANDNRMTIEMSDEQIQACKDAVAEMDFDEEDDLAMLMGRMMKDQDKTDH